MTDVTSWTRVEACTLPTAEQPLREREFDDLFAGSVRAVERVGAVAVRLALTPTPEVAARAADLAVREAGCCSFFAFDLTVSGGGVWLEVRVPSGREAVLEGLVRRAEALAGRADGVE